MLTHSWRERDGKPIHDGDCRIWDIQICTCGLLHALRPEEPNTDEKFWKDFANHDHTIDYILRNPAPKREELSPEAQENLNKFVKEHWTTITQQLGLTD